MQYVSTATNIKEYARVFLIIVILVNNKKHTAVHPFFNQDGASVVGYGEQDNTNITVWKLRGAAMMSVSTCGHVCQYRTLHRLSYEMIDSELDKNYATSSIVSLACNIDCVYIAD